MYLSPVAIDLCVDRIVSRRKLHTRLGSLASSSSSSHFHSRYQRLQCRLFNERDTHDPPLNINKGARSIRAFESDPDSIGN